MKKLFLFIAIGLFLAKSSIIPTNEIVGLNNVVYYGQNNKIIGKNNQVIGFENNINGTADLIFR